MYPAVMSNLLGKCNAPGHMTAIQEFKQKFAIYDEGFEYGSQLPDLFLREWAQAKQWLLSTVRNMISRVQDNECTDTGNQTLLQHLVTTITDKFLPNYGLLMLWASLANAIPITFWTIAFMMSNPITYRTAMEQIDAAMKKQDKKKTSLTLEDLQQMPYVKWCILEAMRLRAPGAITRKVVQPIKLQNYIIPSGDLLMMSPYWAHRNPEYFPNPEEFRPERWEQADLVKNAFLEGFVAFGGGKYQCPGRVLFTLWGRSSRRDPAQWSTDIGSEIPWPASSRSTPGRQLLLPEGLTGLEVGIVLRTHRWTLRIGCSWDTG
ncbi:24-hydroxycholesterol 7-alpha-hydroxylase-like isoform X2 [Denticeps clupeoides]|uniref:24-hydroxycholesterol 7-alpha-hydroxylase-like isoform X2 n=1 Tax=Denticeps clupeoides TaxID=299321 RepID=UPI0010A4FAF2|nr:24-hydroxycholesterol 7-alpha-hydroxylase-like isoform X2 [Denticeps clupeoides]